MEIESVLDNLEINDEVISQSELGSNVYLLKRTCNCTPENSVAKIAEQSNVMHLNPSVIFRGWETHRVIAFNHEDLTNFIQHIEEKGFNYKMNKKTPLVGQLSSNQLLNIESIFSNLTKKQIDAVLTSYQYGYFDFPRKNDMKSIAEKEQIVRTTLSEHLKKGQNKLIRGIIPYLYLYNTMTGQG